MLKSYTSKKNIFISYAREYKAVAEEIAVTLRMRGYTVFFDLDNLPAGHGYDHQIHQAIKKSDLFIFLISPQAVQDGSYTLTELNMARQKWPNPANHILPVAIAKTRTSDISAYLRAVTILNPRGNLAAEVAIAVERMKGAPKTGGLDFDVSGLTFVALMGGLGIGAGIVSGIFGDAGIALFGNNYLLPCILFGLLLAFGVRQKCNGTVGQALAAVLAGTGAQFLGAQTHDLLHRVQFAADHVVYAILSGGVAGAVFAVTGALVCNTLNRTSLWPVTVAISAIAWSVGFEMDILQGALFWIANLGIMLAWTGHLLSKPAH